MQSDWSVSVVSADPEVTQEEPTWRLSLDHRFSDEFMMFASYNRGFKSGLYNMVNLSQDAVDSEIVDAYEIGFKSDLADDRVRLNGSVFYYDYSDLQIQVIQRGHHVLYNAARRRSRAPNSNCRRRRRDNLRIYAGSLSYLDTEFTDFPRRSLSTPNIPFPGNTVTTGSAHLATSSCAHRT